MLEEDWQRLIDKMQSKIKPKRIILCENPRTAENAWLYEKFGIKKLEDQDGVHTRGQTGSDGEEHPDGDKGSG